MSKQYKIKRHRQYGAGSSFRARPHPVMVVLGVVALAGLVVLGVVIYQSIFDLMSGNVPIADAPSSQAEGEPEPDTQAAASEPEQEPVVPSPKTGLQAVYMPHDTAIDPAARDRFLSTLAGTGINAVMIDIKNAAGNVLFSTANPQAAQWDTVSVNPLDLASFADTLEAKGFTLVARMSAFRDPIAARAGRENAVSYQNSEMLWLDAAPENGGKPWLNPYAPGTQDYLTALALEAVQAGARMVVLNDLQFPPYSGSNATFGASAQGTRAEALNRFLESFSQELREQGARTAVYLPAIALTQDSENAICYGGSPMELPMETLVIGALPYQFGGNDEAGGLAIQDPAAQPAGVTAEILRYLEATYPQTKEMAIIPLLQGGSEPALALTPEQVAAQIGAVEAAGLGEYLLYSTTGAYALGS